MTHSCPFVLLDDSLDPAGLSHLFVDPLRIVSVTDPAQVGSALDAIADATAQGLFAAGFLSYELGYLMESRLAPLLPRRRRLPLIWMGLFRERRELTPAETQRWLEQQATGDFRLGPVELAWSRERYKVHCRRVLDYIAAGDVYQINLTTKGKFTFEGDPTAFYLDLRRRQKVAYGAFIAMPGFHILSLSPELFLRAADGKALARPMKGTAPRGATAEEDARLRAWLATDVKSRAENLMIVDLMRNDLGRVAEPGGVSVPDLFTVETYRTVLQMTSGVEARLREGVGLRDLLAATFAPGSVTGAPKVRAMEIIRELEDEPREVYTGAIGMIGPGGAGGRGAFGMTFNVAIRTVVLDDAGRAEIGVGGGVVQDSRPDGEYDECLLKMRFLTEPLPAFKLFETLRWQAGRGYDLLERHLERLEASARHLGFVCDPARVRAALDAQAVRCALAQPAAPVQRVRITLGEDGSLETAASPLELPGPSAVFRYAISDRPVDSGDPLLRHKTTLRRFYDGERERLAALTGCQEALFVNERGELTEGSFTTLFLRKGGRLLTPPLACGLLPGTLRAELLSRGEAEEGVLRPEDLAQAEELWLGNSVRGLIRAEPAVAPSPAGATESAKEAATERCVDK